MICPVCHSSNIKSEDYQGVTYFECDDCDYGYPEQLSGGVS